MIMMTQKMVTFDIRHFWFLAARWKMRVAWGEALINHIIIMNFTERHSSFAK